MSVPEMSASGHAQRRYVRNDPVACLHKKFRTIYSLAILEQGTYMYLLTRRRLLKFSCNEIVKFFLKMHINLQLRDKAQKASRSH